MDRYLASFVKRDLGRKLVLLSGPRQVGKTYLSKHLHKDATYLSFDEESDRKMIREKSWSRDSDLIVLDELHKWPQWKRWLKGIYDTEGVKPPILVTGSARMDAYRKMGDSLAGRHFLYRLHPLSIKEVDSEKPDEVLEGLLKFGGFPEPFLSQSMVDANRWRISHLDRIIRQDLLDLEQVRNVKLLEILVQLLSERVGSTISSLSLAHDLGVSPHTIRRWIQILESLFVIFVVTPYSKNIAKSILKEPKIYFYDTGRVQNGDAARFENLVACHLRKRADFLVDTQGASCELFYLRDRNKREIDFLSLRDRKPEYMIDVKWADSDPSSNFKIFSKYLPSPTQIQLVAKTKRDLQFHDVQVKRAGSWLANLEC